VQLKTLQTAEIFPVHYRRLFTHCQRSAMRLSKIKLAGFKSFVDPTTVNFPSNLVGIVGPNGCGKSNIIDAVRWVMGEISAKHLRGDSMADVVFNGSASRKPVGTASVELVFDNADGQLSGQYAGYAEVALKRVVSRDGTSAYFLNGARCRRKDITQLFLGTGLGSRSYAIIEQGMISRVIEARPEDLRGFLEEAAGISKYKERRRETENRISHTKENLERLNDLREEVDKQLRHLQRQAATARRYQALKQDERKYNAELLALKLRELDADAVHKDRLLNERETALQGAIADLREIESAIESARAEFTERSEAVNEVQARYYQIGSEISRIEQSIQHGRDLRHRQRTDLEQVERGLVEVEQHFERDQAQIDALQAELARLAPELELAREREQVSSAKLETAEEAMQTWQEEWELFNREARDASEKTQVERARIEQLDNQLRRSTAQGERIALELDGLADSDLESQIGDLHQEVVQAQEGGAEAAQQLSAINADVQTARERERTLVGQVDQSRRELQELQGRLVSLDALQQAALGRAQGKVTEWLAVNALKDKPRLAQQITVDAGWDRAVETVLGSYLEAVCVDHLDSVAGMLDSLSAGSVTFFSSSDAAEATSFAGDALTDHVRGPAVVQALLSGIIAVETLHAALALRARLERGQSIITRDGIWIGQDWLRVSRDKDVHAGVLSREQEMRSLREQVNAAEAKHAATDAELSATRMRVKQLEEARDRAQQEANQLHRSYSDLNARLASMRSRAEQHAERVHKLEADRDELQQEIEDTAEQVSIARERLQEGMDEMERLESTRMELEHRRDRLRQELGLARSQAQTDRNYAQETALAVESKRSAHVSVLAGLERMRAQIAQLQARREELQRQLADGAGPLEELAQQLAIKLEERIVIERELTAVREQLSSVEGKMRELDERHLTSEEGVEETRRLLDEVRLAEQEIKVRRENFLERFHATQFELETVYAEMLPEAAIATWEEALSEITQKIERLGQVNLAAIDEFKEQSERKEYLDRQLKDLTDALEILETAIRKIDRETRARFQDTFDRVNAGLKERFPRLFGGGHAYLELAGEDVLDAGVAIMARPPGKRNSTINQLSGGEKALTAVALVFSIFELNPAPFCLLDEVDAPLDDNNVGRFCETVREMSQRVQFLFITHNKSTMELAQQLMGVTMHEPGVSRLVAVDVEEAVRMAAM
jgi:chromosome segregation protein